MDREEPDGLNEAETRGAEDAWEPVPEIESDKWQMEKERYDEVIEYIREVDEILNLIKPFPREESPEKRAPPARSSEPHRFGLDHLETILKLVEQLKELQENNHKQGERTCYLKDLKKLREHKRKLKSEEQEMRNRVRVRSITTFDEEESLPGNRKSSSTSEKFEREPKERWQEKRKSICLGENRSKVSKWTKVKEAFHWEKTATVGKTLKRENSVGEKSGGDGSPYGSNLDVFCSPPTPPPPPPPPPPQPLRYHRPEDLLSVRPAQDLPSSSSSDRVDEFLSFSDMKEMKAEGNCPAADEVEEGETPMRQTSYDEINSHLTKDERSTKANKTTWGKVKDIIQTRKDSLKKKPKKRGSDEFKKRRKLSTVSNPQFSDQFEDLSSPEDKIKNMDLIPKFDYQDEQPVVEEKLTKRLTPALTVTLPSTEELRSFSSEDINKTAEEDKTNILSQFSCQAQYCEDKSKFAKSKSGSNQRLSRWIKVKRVFLTSTAPAPSRSTQYLPVTNSSPTSQNKSSGFFSDLESDDLSSGEWIEDKSPSQERTKLTYPEPSTPTATLIQDDIRKSYQELQKKLSPEFDQKLKEWEGKNEGGKQEEFSAKVKGEEGDCIPKFRKTRDSIPVPLPNLNDLSPEFKKKLNDWKKMKTSQSSSSVSSSTTKDEIQTQNIKIRIGEWQPWRSRCAGRGGKDGLSDEFKKFEEGKNYGNSRPPANKRNDDGTVRRGTKRRDSIKKQSHSRTPSAGDSITSGTSSEKDGKFIRRSQKVKDFHWVEKELQKIEKEKIRLEQEKEKYLEREARLEKMKKTMGASPTQEILVRTPEGFFRFKGISQKFTKKLYEWEKARGIAPEASTFALLEESAQTGVPVDGDGDGVAMQRSKSTGSVPELSSALLLQTMAHHPSSLSLNDVDELKLEEEDESISLDIKEEPQAVIVDVEDVEEETAALADDPPFLSETPVYTYTSEDIEKITESRARFYLSSGFGIEVNQPKEEKLEESKRDVEEQPLKQLEEEEEEEKIVEPISLQVVKPATSSGAFQSISSPEPEKNTSETTLVEQTSTSFSHWTKKSQDLTLERQTDSQTLKRKMKEKITLMQRTSTDSSWRWEEYKDGSRRHEKTEEDQTTVNVFVPTSRKIISPVKTTDGVCSYVIDDVKPERKTPEPSPVCKKKTETPKRDIGMPPLPNSPKTHRKTNAKETAPSIRMIIAKYNQKISEHDGGAEGKRPESGTPAWKSPVFGRRTAEKIEKFTGEVQKSASLDSMRSKMTQGFAPPNETDIKGILKSSSVGVMKTTETSPSVLRAMKIQKAKEEFLSGKVREAPNVQEVKEDSDGGLTKSVSAETVSGETNRMESQPERTSEVRQLQKSNSKFDISSIKSKFRKMRMRREKANAVAVLCRQSLFIEVPKSSENSALSKSCPSSPVMDRSKMEKPKSKK